jgi:hypothetical protein
MNPRSTRAGGLLVLLLSGCGGGGDGPVACAAGFSGGSVVTNGSACNNCGTLNPNAAIDDRFDTFATLSLGINGGQLTVRARAPEGRTFAAGSNAGALMRFPRIESGGFTNVGVRFNTYSGDTAVDTNEGGTLTGFGNADGAGTDVYYAVTPSQAVDSIEAVVSLSGNAEVEEIRLYEFCGNR